MKNKFFAAILAALAIAVGVAGPAAASGRDDVYRHSSALRMMDISVRVNGRNYDFGYGDRMFMRLIDQPYGFAPGLNYVYTDRCNRYGCVVFVYDDYRRRPVDRIFAPHLPVRGYAWRQARGFDPRYGAYGDYNRDDRRFDEHWRYDGRESDDWSRQDRWNDHWNGRVEGGSTRR